MESVQFKTRDKLGHEIICDIIATYHDDDSNKDFVIYTDKTLDDKGCLKIYSALYTKIDENIVLEEIVNNNDKQTALEIIKQIIDDMKH